MDADQEEAQGILSIAEDLSEYLLTFIHCNIHHHHLLYIFCIVNSISVDIRVSVDLKKKKKPFPVWITILPTEVTV